MPIIQNLTKHLDDYLERKPDADVVDVAFTLAQKLTDEQLMRTTAGLKQFVTLWFT